MSTVAPVRVIGLPRSWRGEALLAGLRAAGVEVARVDGVDASAPEERFDDRPPLSWTDRRGSLLVHRRTLTAAEVGCALAHLRAQRAAAAAREEWSIVLEDDVTVPDVGDLARLSEWARHLGSQEPVIVLLYARGAIVAPAPLARVGATTLWDAVLPPDSAVGYLLNRAAARLLTRATLPLIGPSDWPPRTAGAVRFVVASPPVVALAPVASTIGDRGGDAWPRWSRPLRRALLFTGVLWPWYRRHLPRTALITLEWRRFLIRRRLGATWSATSTDVTPAPGRRRVSAPG